MSSRIIIILEVRTEEWLSHSSRNAKYIYIISKVPMRVFIFISIPFFSENTFICMQTGTRIILFFHQEMSAFSKMPEISHLQKLVLQQALFSQVLVSHLSLTVVRHKMDTVQAAKCQSFNLWFVVLQS